MRLPAKKSTPAEDGFEPVRQRMDAAALSDKQHPGAPLLMLPDA
jgi:hypothetical protein